jgi:hypothetical protein
MQTMELGMECVSRNMDAYQLLRERHNEVVRLRAILGSFKETLEFALQQSKAELDSNIEMFNKGFGGRERCLQALATNEAYFNCKQRLQQIEASAR